ncbi:hypothetical protein QN410_25070 [Pseudomonas sp. Bout1]|uniref:hypothetical protein n=1 Tax=Pseudomonas sp. Bout1 TaxID=3048600 RepID=UPI002B3B418A|nr:hypothetical protein [Pseudomonas sp. Bout1]
MSVRELELPLDVEWPAERVTVLPEALAQLRHWAQVTPLHSALRHKRDGQWYAWRWIDALRDVERLTDGLRQQGFTERSRLALSGAFEPGLLLLALAAQAIGGRILTLADDLEPTALEQQLWRIRPTHAYVQGLQPAAIVQRVGAVDTSQRLCRWWQSCGKTELWSQESTHWQGGLAAVLEQWLNSGQSLGFPEAH